MSDAYSSILEPLARAKRVLVTTHVRPDGDALGSTAAMVQGLRAKGIAAHVLLLSAMPAKYAFLYAEGDVPYTEAGREWPASVSLNDFDTLLVVDTGTWSQLPMLKEQLIGWTGAKLVVDHHLTQEDWADAKLVDTTAGAAAEVVAELLRRWGVPLTRPMATALFVGVVSDTGWFQHSNTRPATHRLAAELMDAGVDTDAMQQLLYQNEQPSRVLLQARVLRSLELLCDGKLAVMRTRAGDYAELNATQEDTAGVINVPLQIRTVQVSILLNEPTDDGPVRVSLRSKGTVDVAAFAQAFGGGGHARAAGLKIDGTLAAAYEAVTAAMVRTLCAA